MTIRVGIEVGTYAGRKEGRRKMTESSAAPHRWRKELAWIDLEDSITYYSICYFNPQHHPVTVLG